MQFAGDLVFRIKHISAAFHMEGEGKHFNFNEPAL
jgi:hypothetical protein